MPGAGYNGKIYRAANSGYSARPMPHSAPNPKTLTNAEARRIWLRAQRLDRIAPFGDGPEATRLAVEHLGYVQIDTINVIPVLDRKSVV